MVSFVTRKLKMKKDIMAAVNTAGKLDKNKLIAKFSLDTGFTETTIKKMLSQMYELGYINIDGNIITVGSGQEKPEIEQ